MPRRKRKWPLVPNVSVTKDELITHNSIGDSSDKRLRLGDYLFDFLFGCACISAVAVICLIAVESSIPNSPVAIFLSDFLAG